jgi:hypothetical protein
VESTPLGGWKSKKKKRNFRRFTSRTRRSTICSCVHHGPVWPCYLYVCMCGNSVPPTQTHRSTCRGLLNLVRHKARYVYHARTYHRAVRLTRVPVNGPFLLLVFLRKCDETVSYHLYIHLYIVNRYLWVLVPHTIRICL